MGFIHNTDFLNYGKQIQIENVKKGLTSKEINPTVLNHLFVKK